ncbi:MAG: hypothetical protein Q8O55_08715 [Dehalococcoidales bacterium]|nr:hypothetical protein [Dehalococcoidales bacterium]
MTNFPTIIESKVQSLPQAPANLPARISAQALAIMEENITLLETFVQNSLIPDVDYGSVKGIPDPFLQDPGSQKIINAFSCYFEPEILQYTIDPDKDLITYIVRVKVIERGTNTVKAEGMGVASTLEQKYGKRWVKNPEDYGIDKEGLRTRTGKYPDKETGELPTEWQIPSPDWGDMVNTLLAMATKRAEMDAAKAMPGVSSALRIIFMGETVPQWKAFWQKMRSLNISSEQVHSTLHVPSLKDWLDNGRTLGQAEAELIRKFSKQQGAGGSPPPGGAQSNTINMTLAQYKFMVEIATKAGWDEKGLLGWLAQKVKKPIEELSKDVCKAITIAQASDLIEQLKKEV